MSFEETQGDNHNKKKIKNLFFPSKSNFERMIKQIKKCETSMFICMYQITHSMIIDTLIDLAKKGRSINIVIDQHQDEVEEKRSQLISKLLVFSDFKINMALRFGEGLMHNKFCIIDEQTVICGSANWTFQAFSNNEEFVQILKDKSSAKQFLQQYNKIWDRSKTIQLINSQISYIPNKKCKEQKNKPIIQRRFIKKDRKNQKIKFFRKRKNGFRQFNKRKQQLLMTKGEKESLQNTPRKIAQLQAETNKCSEEVKENLKDNQDPEKQIITSSFYENLKTQFKFETVFNSEESWANEKIHALTINSKNKGKVQNQKNEIIIIDDQEELQFQEDQKKEQKAIFD